MSTSSNPTNSDHAKTWHPIPDAQSAPDHPDLNAFIQTIAALRSENGCPWDKKQTNLSIAKNMLEEAFEAVDAIEQDDVDHMREELGDVLLQVVLQAQIAQDAGLFSFDDVAHDVNEKIIRRHPHVFGPRASLSRCGMSEDEIAEVEQRLTKLSPEEATEALDVWDTVKAFERKQKEERARAKRAEQGLPEDLPRGVLEDVAFGQPALLLAQEISNKAVRVGFEWESIEDIWRQVEEEIEEFKAAPAHTPEKELEFGDVLFSLVNVARKEGLDAERALRATANKFRSRWEYMERKAFEAGKRIEDVPTETMEAWWQQSKAHF